jgi:DNA polymerase elongation subunit (family B)
MKLVNIANVGRNVYKFIREDDYSLRIEEDNTFYPFFYELDERGKYNTYDGKKARIVFANEPRDIAKMKSLKNSYSSDVPFVKNYLTYKVPLLEETKIKYLFIDIEILAKEMPSADIADKPVSCITVYNSHNKEYKTWWLKDYKDSWKSNNDSFLLKDFCAYIKEQSPDIIMGWHFVDFDYKYLHNRIKNFALLISPVNETRRGSDENILFPVGISVVDYMEWFKKVSLREPSYALNEVCQRHLNDGDFGDSDFGTLNEHVREKNINDVKRLVNLEEKFKIVKYFDDIRRLSFAQWEELTHNSYIIEMLLLKEAKEMGLVLPNKPSKDKNKESTFQGAIREAEKTGRLFDIGKYDLGCYSEDTQILSENGWKYYHELNQSELVATFNIEKNKVEFDNVLHLNIKHVENCEMYNIINKRTDQLITWNHRVLFKQITKSYRTHENNPDSWHIQFAKDVPLHHSNFPLSGEIDKSSDYNISDDLLKLHAWIITEGWNSKYLNNSYSLCQSRTKNSKFCDEINNIFLNLKWDIKEKQRIRKNKVESEWYLLVEYSKFINLEENYKVIPLWMLKNLSLRQLNVLFFELMKGDGNKKTWCYNAVDSLARDRFQYLCCLIGRASSNTGNKNVYCCDEKYTSIIWSKNSKFKAGKNKLFYTGNVWCPTVKNGFIIVRRNGKPFISGNSAYPNIIINFNLDAMNLSDDGLDIGGIKIKQNSEALLPKVVSRLLVLKNNLKKELGSKDFKSEEYNKLETKYNAIKGVINSAFGVIGYPGFRLFNEQIVSSITFLVRDLLNYARKRSNEDGNQVIYWDTDAVFVENKNNIVDKLNGYIKEWANKYNKDSVDISFEFEGIFEKIFILSKCRYIGYIETKKGLKEEIKGLEIKRSSSSKNEAAFQREMFRQIFEKDCTKDSIEAWIKEEKKKIKTLDLLEVGFPCKLNEYKDYVNEPIFVRAYKNRQLKDSDFRVNGGERFYWIYTKIKDKDANGKEMNVIAFNAKFPLLDKSIVDYDEVIRRNITSKAENIYEAMKWETFSLHNDSMQTLF